MRCLICLLFAVAIGCGGSGSSPTSSSPPPSSPPPSSPGSGSGSTPTPSNPVVMNRTFRLERLTIDSGPTPFVLQSPEASGSLAMQASGRYLMSFRVAVGSLVWEESIGGTHTFVGNTLRLTPNDSLKNAPVPFQQTVIVENTDVPWLGETRVVINLPIRPGGFRAEDRIELSYVQGTSTGSGLTRKTDEQTIQRLVSLVSRFGGKKAMSERE